MTNSVSSPLVPPPPSEYDRMMEAVNAARRALAGKEISWDSEYGLFLIEFQRDGNLGLGFDTDGDGKYERQLILQEAGPSYFLRDAVADPKAVEILPPTVPSYTLFNNIYEAGEDQFFTVQEQEALTPVAATLMNLQPRSVEPGGR